MVYSGHELIIELGAIITSGANRAKSSALGTLSDSQIIKVKVQPPRLVILDGPCSFLVRLRRFGSVPYILARISFTDVLLAYMYYIRHPHLNRLTCIYRPLPDGSVHIRGCLLGCASDGGTNLKSCKDIRRCNSYWGNPNRILQWDSPSEIIRDKLS